jgi:succinate dehydrogenase / fumarate reductase cytochrome b subunit
MSGQSSTKTAARPLSPHLQVYRLPLTAITSVLHRITGAGLAVGLVMFTWWLVAAATGPEAYATFISFASSPLGLIMLLGWSVAFSYHLANGIRHLIWDSGYLFKKASAHTASCFVLVITLVLTTLMWCWFYN